MTTQEKSGHEDRGSLVNVRGRAALDHHINVYSKNKKEGEADNRHVQS